MARRAAPRISWAINVPNLIRLDACRAPELADLLNFFYQCDQKIWCGRIRLDARQVPELADLGIKTWKMSKLFQYELKEKKEKKKEDLRTKTFEPSQVLRAIIVDVSYVLHVFINTFCQQNMILPLREDNARSRTITGSMAATNVVFINAFEWRAATNSRNRNPNWHRNVNSVFNFKLGIPTMSGNHLKWLIEGIPL